MCTAVCSGALLSRLLRLTTAASWAVPGALLAFHLLLVPLALAIAARLLILLPGAAGCTIEAMLVIRFLAAGRGRKDLLAAAARKPILADFHVHVGLHCILARFARNAFWRDCHHVGIEISDVFGQTAFIAL